jgi:proline-rich protein PRCC
MELTLIDPGPTIVALFCRGPTPEELLRQALTGGRSGAAGATVQFREVSAATVQAPDVGRRAEMEGVRVALGGEHIRELHAAVAATGGEPTKRQKQRHQLNSLYTKAKQTEIQFMEGGLQGTKSKAETAAKYGW